VDAVLENPIFVAALVCFLLGFGLSGLVRILPLLPLGSMVSPSVFLASYVLTYQQVPTFPPIGATNKIFYIAVVATLIGFILDLLPRIKNYSKILAAIMSLLIVGWIAYPRFAKADMVLMATSLALWLGGIALLWPLDTVAKTPTERNGGGVVGTAMLASLLLGFAPVALFGGSSTSMMLCLVAVPGLAAVTLRMSVDDGVSRHRSGFGHGAAQRGLVCRQGRGGSPNLTHGKLATFTSWVVRCSRCHCVVMPVAMIARTAASAVIEAM
jgi:hypothetical protein